MEPFGVSFSSIFLHEKKDGVPEGRRISREEGKNEKQNDCAAGGPTEKRMPVNSKNPKFCNKKRAHRCAQKPVTLRITGNLVLFTDRRAANCH